MAVNYKKEYTVNYSNMLGLDRCAGDRRHFSRLVNMYRDYTSSCGEVIESVPGFRILAELGGRINGIFSHSLGADGEYIAVHAGTSLYRFKKSELDSIGIPKPILTNMRDTKSHAFLKGRTLYILDGERITRIGADGTAHRMLNIDAYSPTTFKDGEPYEERNLIGTYFSESITVNEPARLTRRSDGLIFRKSADGKSCTLCTSADGISGEVYVPSYAKLGDDILPVRAIDDYAFYARDSITAVHMADGIEIVGCFAFGGCTRLAVLELSRSVRTVGQGAFSGCSSLKSLYFGEKLELLGTDVFHGISQSSLTISFGMDEDKAMMIENYGVILDAKKIFLATAPKECFAMPIRTPASDVQTLTLDGEVISDFSISHAMTGKIAREVWFVKDASELIGRELRVRCRHASGECYPYEDKRDFETRLINGVSPIAGCTCHTSFDGRIFLGGNPSYPSTVFCTSNVLEGDKDELLFGSLSYFDVGTDSSRVTSLVGVKDALAVFKSSENGSGAIFCHEVKGTDAFPFRSYPVSNIHTGFRVSGTALPHLDAAVFLSDSGVFLLTRAGGYSSIKPCSERINADLIPFITTETELTIWQGYLVIASGDRLFLGDSRRTMGDDRYEWYPVDGVCTWQNDRRVFVYAHTAPEGYSIGKAGEECRDLTVYSNGTEDGGIVYYVRSGSKKLAVLPTGERYGGTEDPLVCVFSDGELLFFGTEGGSLCVFNSDKRGVAPERLAAETGFDPDEYAAKMGKRIHPDFYAFGTHAARYTVMTPMDNAGSPHLAKSTVKDSLTVKVTGGTELTVSVVTDGCIRDKRHVFSGTSIDFSDFDFSHLSFDTRKYVTVGVRDRACGWVEKGVLLQSELFRSPIGIYSVSYRTTHAGKVRR